MNQREKNMLDRKKLAKSIGFDGIKPDNELAYALYMAGFDGNEQDDGTVLVYGQRRVICTHSLAEREVACFEGLCPICLDKELNLIRGEK